MKAALRRSLLPALLLVVGLAASAAAQLQLREPVTAPATPVTDRWFAEQRSRPVDAASALEPAGLPADTGRAHRLRAALEIGTGMVLYGAHYYTAGRSVNSVDWDYGSGGSLRARFQSGDAYRFDDNQFRINRNHAYAGLYYYEFARSNNLGVAESFLYTLAASSIWEYAIEYREPVSINDQIVTTMGGLALGETLYQIAGMLARKPNTLAEAIVAGVLDIPSELHRRIDGTPAAGSGGRRLPPTPGDRSFFDVQATLRLSNDRVLEDAPTSLFAVEAGVVNVPDLAEPGTARAWIDDTAAASLKVEVPLNNDRVSDFSFKAQSTLAALHYKDLARTSGGDLQGYTLFLGPGSAFTLLNAGLSGPDAHADFMGVTHLLGPVLDAAWYLGGTRVRCAVELYGDFAMVRSYAFEGFQNSRALPEGKGLLEVSRYYFGLGYTGSARLSVDRDPFEFGAGFRYGSSWSINALPDDPQQPNLELDVWDDRAVAEAWFSYRVSDRFALRIAVERTERDGSVDEYNPPAATEVRTFATLSYRLR